MRTALFIALAALLAIVALVVWQDRLLYFPSTARVETLVDADLRAWPSAAEFRGLVAEPRGPVRGTAVVFHGNAGHVGHRAFYARALGPLGLRVVLAEYPGYGPRPGKAGEASLVADAAETIARIARQHGRPLVVIGESLGAGVAAAAASRQRDAVDGLVLITPWDRLETVASHHYPWLPVRWLLRDRYDSASHLARIGRPVVVVVAEEDRIVPPSSGAALAESLTADKTLRIVAGAGHNDWVAKVDADWWRATLAPVLR